MQRNQVLTVIRAVSVVLVLVAIVAQAVELANHGLLDPTRFFWRLNRSPPLSR